MIGKSLFLFYVLARRLHDRGSVAFQIDAHKYCLFDQNGVTLHSTTYGCVPKGTWALSDTDIGDRDGPCAGFWNPAFHVIHTSSPSSTHWKRWVKILGASKYIMDVWGPEEFQTLLCVACVLHRSSTDVFIPALSKPSKFRKVNLSLTNMDRAPGSSSTFSPVISTRMIMRMKSTQRPTN